MIYTVTFNPALDYVVKVNHFTLGMVNRTVQEDIYYGGKGINVSTVLKLSLIHILIYSYGLSSSAIEDSSFSFLMIIYVTKRRKNYQHQCQHFQRIHLQVPPSVISERPSSVNETIL